MKKIFLILTVFTLFFVGCQKSMQVADVDYAVQESRVFAAKSANLKSAAAPESVMLTANGAFDTAIPDKEYSKKIVKNGNINVEVENLTTSEDIVSKWVTKYEGYISNTYSTKTLISITAKIPTAKFDEAMNEVGTFGKVVNRSIYTDDVTDQYYDLETRLKNRKILQSKLQDYLKSAKDISELLKIENQLNSVTSEIESMESQFKNLNTRIDYATINVECFLPENTTEDGFDTPDFGNELSDFGHKALYFFSGFGIAILYIIIFGVPIILLAAILFWVSFGKLGLVKKLFKKLK